MESEIQNSLNALRTTYMNMFSQIFDNSININCICKNALKSNSNVPGNVFDKCNNGFMDDDDDDEDDSNYSNTDSEMKNNTENMDGMNATHSLNRICDLSCFENLKFVSFSLKNCIGNVSPNEELTREQIQNFEKTIENFRFLTLNPVSCDYNGTTIFHYAATENNYHLLKLMLSKYQKGVLSVDSKGMTPLMRAVQRNSISCVELLLNETESDINGSSFSAYTPLWFSVSNGYNHMGKLLLNYGASPSIICKNKTNLNDQNDINTLIRNEDHVGIRSPQGYQFSPLRASIVYSRFDTMIHLLEYGANVNELFDMHQSGYVLKKEKSNEEYVNSLKFFYREFSKSNNSDKSSNEKYLRKLNHFIENQNVYRRMLLEFVKDVCFKIKSNILLLVNINQFNSKKTQVQFLLDLTENLEHNSNVGDWIEYISIVHDFMISLDMFLKLQQTERNENILPVDLYKALEYRKPNYYQQIFEFSRDLFDKYFAPKTLKEICRFEIRKLLFNQIEISKVKYHKNFSKMNHKLHILNKIGLPSYLNDYILHLDY